MPMDSDVIYILFCLYFIVSELLVKIFLVSFLFKTTNIVSKTTISPSSFAFLVKCYFLSKDIFILVFKDSWAINNFLMTKIYIIYSILRRSKK